MAVNNNKVLILTESIGGNGHFRAAQAIAKGLDHEAPTVGVDISCGLPQFSRQLEGVVRKVYLNTLQYAPQLWGAAYKREEAFSDAFRSGVGKVIAAKLRRFLDPLNPEVVICTHAFCLGAAGYVKEQASQPYRLGAAITDFDVNGFWVHPAVDFYLVAHEGVAKKLHEKYGVPKERVHHTGIPIDPDFSRSRPDKGEIRKMLGVAPDPFTIMLMGGGLGLGPLERSIEQFQKDMPTSQLLVITGKNRPLLERLSARFGEKRNVHLFGYVQGMADWMGAADVIVTKPGGLTSSECLATGLPMVICRPIPGQEERNSQFLMQKKVALRQDRPGSIPRHISPLLDSPDAWREMSFRARRLGRPDSARDAAQIILQHLSYEK
ncbi:MGDG synthase family glycosyltransferase [Marininema halotolerans]|uniref:Processive 1,2-diacylglycerol beta-glucosyltransferase n=1 Tax=Marininema halotolerans TaxID=1155944 RepID=A0A1I6STK5_9BACL|nr:glycosyltransferase [Marininema halotolerans]SFS80226.1 processive 1,2-diacylglycerol beta-glucosyltransferase [Marininema halotolerans]